MHALLVTQCKHMHTNINSFPMQCIILVAVPFAAPSNCNHQVIHLLINTKETGTYCYLCSVW